MSEDTDSASGIIETLTSYIENTRQEKLPPDIVERAKHHILDTLAAIVSGSVLKSGLLAKSFIATQGGVREAQVVGSSVVTSAINAAFANGMMGHAGETDDFEPISLTHPGTAILPATLALAERERADGMSFLKGIVLGYDICCRITKALVVEDLQEANISTHGLSGIFGAASAAASIMKMKADQVRYVMAYTVQQSSGRLNWLRDEEHIEKAFVYGAMPARDGVAAVLIVQAGFTGVRDPFSGDPCYFFNTISPRSQPQQLVKELGSRYDIMAVTLKKYPVGGPIQAALEALYILKEKHDLKPENVKNIIARLPSNTGSVVSNREMPNINLQHIFALTILDGKLSFVSSLSHERMNDPAVLDIKKRVELIPEDDLVDPIRPRQAIVEVTKTDGSKFQEHVTYVRGSAANPMNRQEVEDKCLELIEPVLGDERSKRLIERIWNIEQVADIRELRPFLSA
ncbi:MmgE/PrpD family protein [Thermodesulfobacteriota bacterium]